MTVTTPVRRLTVDRWTRECSGNAGPVGGRDAERPLARSSGQVTRYVCQLALVGRPDRLNVGLRSGSHANTRASLEVVDPDVRVMPEPHRLAGARDTSRLARHAASSAPRACSTRESRCRVDRQPRAEIPRGRTIRQTPGHRSTHPASPGDRECLVRRRNRLTWRPRRRSALRPQSGGLRSDSRQQRR